MERPEACVLTAVEGQQSKPLFRSEHMSALEQHTGNLKREDLNGEGQWLLLSGFSSEIVMRETLGNV